MDSEKRDLPVKQKKYLNAAESHRASYAMYEAVEEYFHPQVRAFVSAPCGRWLEADPPLIEPMVVRWAHRGSLWCPVTQCNPGN